MQGQKRNYSAGTQPTRLASICDWFRHDDAKHMGDPRRQERNNTCVQFLANPAPTWFSLGFSYERPLKKPKIEPGDLTCRIQESIDHAAMSARNDSIGGNHSTEGGTTLCDKINPISEDQSEKEYIPKTVTATVWWPPNADTGGAPTKPFPIKPEPSDDFVPDNF